MSESEPTTWHVCKEPIKHNGKHYAIGDRIELNDVCRQRLSDSDAIDNDEALVETKSDDENPEGNDNPGGDDNVVKLNPGGQGDKAPTPKDEEPVLPEARQVEIVKAITQLEKDNADHWLKDMVTPELKALNDILKWKAPVSKAERDAVIAELSKEQ